MFQFPFPRPLFTLPHERPAFVTPLFRFPKARTEKFPRWAIRPCIMFVRYSGGAAPSWPLYAANSPRFPFGESRRRMPQYPFPRPPFTLPHERPAIGTPLPRFPKARNSRSARAAPALW